MKHVTRLKMAENGERRRETECNVSKCHLGWQLTYDAMYGAHIWATPCSFEAVFFTTFRYFTLAILCFFGIFFGLLTSAAVALKDILPPSLPTPHSLPSSSLLPSIALHFYHKMQLSRIPISCTSEILGLILIMLCPTTKKELGLNLNDGNPLPKSTNNNRSWS